MDNFSEIFLHIFWEGTANTLIHPVTTQIGEFYVATHAQTFSNLPPKDDEMTRVLSTTKPHVKICFDGCGVTHGCAGIICAHGLRGQAEMVVQIIRSILRLRENSVVFVNVVGQSRGAIGSIFLAQQLGAAKDIPTKSLNLRMLLFDPVPGNLICTSILERFLGCSLFGFCLTSNHCDDLRSARHLMQVLAIYPHEPLPSLVYHAPVLLVYPEHTMVEEDVTLGCHQGALFSGDLACKLSRIRISEFLESCGAVLSLSESNPHATIIGARGDQRSQDLRELIQQLEGEMQLNSNTTRIAHLNPAGRIPLRKCCSAATRATILRRTVNLKDDKKNLYNSNIDESDIHSRPYLNLHHEKLVKITTNGSVSNVSENFTSPSASALLFKLLKVIIFFDSTYPDGDENVWKVPDILANFSSKSYVIN